MRRILAILLIIFIAFWVAYGIIPPVKAAVDGFILNTVGPTAYNALNTAYTGVITSFGVGGFAAMVLTGGFIIGMVTHLLWVKADWRLRRWGHTRTSKDLGVSPVTHISTTPATATTRPTTVAATQSVPTSAEIPAEEPSEKESENV